MGEIELFAPALANSISAGLIPGDGIGREVIPVSPRDYYRESLLTHP
jgi:hypothetical protein